MIIWTGVEGWVECREGGRVRWRVKMPTRILAVISTRVPRVLPNHSGRWVSGGESLDWRWSRVEVEVHIDVYIHTALLIIWF